jgi:mannitol-specific phosphotransferase system IIBC component
MFGVFMFSRHQKPPEVTVEEKAAETQVDTALAKLVEMNENDKSKDLFKNVDTMVQTFYDYPSNQQVAADDLQKNPFSRYIIDADAGQGSSKARAELEKELRKKFNQLKLQTVAGSKCVISSEVVGEGQKVADTFLVKTISTDSVVLVAEDIEFVLQM